MWLPRFSALLLALAIVAGTLADRPHVNPPLTLGGFRVLAVDFHTHSAPAMERLDGAEICHPGAFVYDTGQDDLERFAARAPVAAIGSSDFHGLGPMGICRTYVFAADASEQGILDGVRAHRTVVYGRDGHAYGDPALVRLAEDAGGFRDREPWRSPVGWLEWASRIGGVLGLSGVIFSRHRFQDR